jgi:hypothetical protein
MSPFFPVAAIISNFSENQKQKSEYESSANDMIQHISPVPTGRTVKMSQISDKNRKLNVHKYGNNRAVAQFVLEGHKYMSDV